MVDLSSIENVNFDFYLLKVKRNNVMVLTVIDPEDLCYFKAGINNIMYCYRLASGRLILALLNPETIPKDFFYLGCELKISQSIEISNAILKEELKRLLIRLLSDFEKLLINTFLSSDAYISNKIKRGSTMLGIKVQ